MQANVHSVDGRILGKVIIMKTNWLCGRVTVTCQDNNGLK